jgi:glycosyltransferase involved in cell wall biosynthesis
LLSTKKNILFLLRTDHLHNTGGDVVQARTTAAYLQKFGYHVDVLTYHEVKDWSKYHRIQVFNVGRPAEIIPVLQKGIPVYLFTIWVDFYHLDVTRLSGFKRFIAKMSGAFGWEYLKTFARWTKNQVPFPGWRYLFTGHRRSMQYVLDRVAGAFASTENEWQRLSEHFELPPVREVVPLGVDVSHISDVSQRIEPHSVCFGGYIEPRKGVLELIRVCNKRGWKLHVFGKPSKQNIAYFDQCKKEAGANVIFHGYQSREAYLQQVIRSAVVALPSWFETTGLAALEAACLEKPVVVGRGGDTAEVFGDYAHYVDPGNEAQLEAQIEKAFSWTPTEASRKHFAQFSMKAHAEALSKFYQKKRVILLGTRGVPNQYGGFEALAEALAQHINSADLELWIQQPNDHIYKESKFEHAHLLQVNNPENALGTFGQFFYDLNAILAARRKTFDLWVHLGYTSNTLWHFLWAKHATHISNMDGLEWQRSKYHPLVQRFLRWAERRAVKSSHFLIADHPAIAAYLREKYQRESTLIAYGADEQMVAEEGPADHLPVYDMLMARMEPENHVHLVVEAHARASDAPPLVVVGALNNGYARKLQKRFPSSERLIWLGGVYDSGVVERLRKNCRLYFHGHSAGGTNPSLVQAMASSCRIVAHDNPFNKGVLGDKALAYFSSMEDVMSILDTSIPSESVDFSGSYAQWIEISEQYETLFRRVLNGNFRRE